MKWSFNKLDLQYLHNTERIVAKFLWLPRKFNFEYRWLEKAYIRERVKDTSKKYVRFNWCEIDYATEEDYIKYFNIITFYSNLL
jgi:hypothetical protein